MPVFSSVNVAFVPGLPGGKSALGKIPWTSEVPHA
jgi:hypothetical protein